MNSVRRRPLTKGQFVLALVVASLTFLTGLEGYVRLAQWACADVSVWSGSVPAPSRSNQIGNPMDDMTLAQVHERVVREYRRHHHRCTLAGSTMNAVFRHANLPRADACWQTTLWRVLVAEGKMSLPVTRGVPVNEEWVHYRESLAQNLALTDTLRRNVGLVALYGVNTPGWLIGGHWSR